MDRRTNGKRILQVNIVRMPDTDPDTSWLGEYSATPSSRWSIDRAHTKDCADAPKDCIDTDEQECECCGGDMRRGEYRYFNPSFNYVDKHGKLVDGNTSDDVVRYTRQDYERMEALNAGQWGFIGIKAQATIQNTQHGPIQHVSSGGLWGIESDSEQSYFAEVASEELSQLRKELHAMGFSKRAIARACKDVQDIDE
jgi:hypothetical protein